jgi:simple sugar transport system permease protein
VTLLAIVLALVIGGVLMALSDSTVRSDFGFFFQHPSDALSDSWYTVRDAYRALFEGAFYNPSNDGSVDGIFGPIAGTVYTAAPLICAGLGISLAFRAGLFNIGGQGQVIAGAMASGYVGFAVHLPVVLHLIVAIVAGVAGGAFWGFLAGFLKARFGAHEVITTIMLNYVALNGLAFLIQTHGIQNPSNPQTSKIIMESARLPHLFGAGLSVDLGIVLALVAAVGVWWLMTRSTLGFRLRSVGANPAAARTAGMNVSTVTMTAMALAGALTGLAGTLLSLGGATQYAVTPQIDNNVGFDAITVALLGRNSPWGTVGAGLLLGALRSGAPTMQAQTNVPPDIVTVIQALIVIFVAAPRLTRAIFRLKGRGRSSLAGVTTSLVVTVNTVRTARYPRHLISGVTEIVLGLLALWIFGLGSRSTHRAIFHFSLQGARFDLGSWSVQARWIAIVLALLVVVAGVLRVLERLAAKWCAAITIFGVLVSFMTWSIAGDPNGMNIVSLLQGSLFPSAIPLVLGALAGVIGERAGVVNVALEGQLLLGAFAAAFVGSVTHSVWAGILGGALAGVLVAALLSVLAIRYLVDQVIVGVVLNVFVLGITNFLFTEVVSQHSDHYNTPGYLKVWKVPLLGDIPIIGPVLFDGTLFLYFAYAAVVAVHFALFHTRWGLRLRSVGEHPRAADTVGINVNRTRYRAMMVAGVIAGLAGALLVVGEGQAGTFSEAMSSGNGYIALAAVIFGKWSPRGAVLAALLFGFAYQLQSLLAQASPPINSDLLLMAPYIATLVAVAGFVGRVRAPAADGQPYTVGG